MEGHVTSASLRSGTLRSRGHPPDPQSSLRYAGFQAVQAQPPNSEKCERVVANTDRVPQWAPLAATTSIHPSSSFTVKDSDAAKEDDPSAHSNTKSRTQAAEFQMASSSVFTSRRTACSTPSCLAASSIQLASRARPEGGPWIRSQTLAPGLSRHNCHSSCLRNLAISSSKASTWKVSLGKRPSANSMVEDTTARSRTSSSAISVLWRAAIRIPFDW
jgi:hypothetical protein